MNQRKVHNSQVAGPSNKISHSLFDYCSDSTVEEESNEPINYNTMHPPSPKKSKGDIVKRNKKPQIMQDMSNTQNVSFIDVHSTACDIDDTDERKSQSEENAAYDSDVPIQVTNQNITEKSSNKDELSSDVDIAPSGIVARRNDDYESDKGNIPLKQNWDVSIEKRGNYISNTIINTISNS